MPEYKVKEKTPKRSRRDWQVYRQALLDAFVKLIRVT